MRSASSGARRTKLGRPREGRSGPGLCSQLATSRRRATVVLPADDAVSSPASSVTSAPPAASSHSITPTSSRREPATVRSVGTTKTDAAPDPTSSSAEASRGPLSSVASSTTV